MTMVAVMTDLARPLLFFALTCLLAWPSVS